MNMIKNEQEYDDEIKENNVETHLHIIRTCEEFLEYTDFRKIVITNKNGEGYYKKKITNQLWNKFYDKDSINFDPNNMEDLLGYIEFEKKNHESDTTKFDCENIYKDIIKKCRVNNPFFYELKYNEYCFPIHSSRFYTEYTHFNSINFSFTPIDEIIDDKILMEENISTIRPFLIKNNINIKIVDDILNILIDNDTKHRYKELMYNIIVSPENTYIFYDTSPNHILTSWTTDLSYLLGIGDKVIESDEYDKKSKPRCIIIDIKYGVSTKIQIDKFSKLGVPNIIVRDKCKNINPYSIQNFEKYLTNNKNTLIQCIEREDKYLSENDINEYEKHWDINVYHYENIFYKTKLLCTNFLKWCCTK